MRSESTDAHAFLWLTGHVRNVGDSMLRRPLTEIYREVGKINVWTGAPGTGYESGLRITEAESAKSFGAWARAFYGAAVRGRPTFVFNAGEFGVTKAYFFGLILLAPALVLSSLKGGHVVWAGAGVNRRRQFLLMWPFDLLARAADDLRWRDVKAPTVMGRGAIMPDWGFGLGPGGGVAPPLDGVERQQRRFIAVSLRGDRREPSPDWTDAVRRLADRLDCELVCIVQVEDDDALAVRIAEQLGAELVGWGGGSHWAQEQRVRDAYANSLLVFSDRLHGLIIAATEGCVPLGWCEATTDKIAKHFDVIDADWVAPRGSSSISLIDGLDSAGASQLVNSLSPLMRAARVSVDQVRRDLIALERDGHRPADGEARRRAQR